tara:strand:+ start:737 stop:1126 length:390 start_codon:yes stop_codon:yes gene_type:complete
MIKLTHESVGKVYVDGCNRLVTILAELPDGSMFDYVGLIDNPRLEGETCFYMANGYQGRYGQGNYDLVSLHTPVRPIEEVMADMNSTTEFLILMISEAICSNSTSGLKIINMDNAKALLAEVQALGVVK